MPHYEKTRERAKLSDSDYILSIQDGTVLNYTSHKAKTKELGRIGRQGKTELYGLIQHSTLLVTAENESLGLIDVQYFHHDDFNTSTHRAHRPLEEKSNRCWVNSLKKTRERLEGINKQVITVADREGDFFEFLQALESHQEAFVIRAQHNRFLGSRYRSTDNKLFERIKQQEAMGEIPITLTNSEAREIKEVQLKIKCLQQIEIPAPPLAKKRNTLGEYPPIFVNVVMTSYGESSWILLTSLPADSLKACKKIVTIYQSRWHIEDYHKILKTGYQIDELYLHASREAIENALTMASLSACRLYWIIYRGRIEETLKAACLFEDYEWKSVYVYFKEKIPEDSPSLAEMIKKIARLGGYKPQKNLKPPGIKSLWLGLQALSVASKIYKNVSLSTYT